MADDLTWLPCAVNGAFVHPCKTLRDVMVESTPKALGVVEVALLNFKTGKPSRRFYAIKGGLHAERGVVINHCPFCGIKISGPVEGGEAKKE